MCDSGLPASMWELAAGTAVHSYNITPHKSINYEIPKLKFSSKSRCHPEQIRRFGCIAYIKLPKTETKFSNVSIKTVLVGHTDTGYVLWHPSSRKFLESRHVRFLEKLLYKDVYKKCQTENKEGKIQNDRSTSDMLIEFSNNELTKEPENSTEINQKHDSGNSELNKTKQRKRGRPKKIDSQEDEQHSELNKKKSTDQINQNTGPVTRSQSKKINDISFARYSKVSEGEEINEDELGHILLASIQKDPTSYEDAMNSEDKDLWKQAVKEEIDSMKENKVWEIVDRPKEKSNGKRPNIID